MVDGRLEPLAGDVVSRRLVKVQRRPPRRLVRRPSRWLLAGGLVAAGVVVVSAVHLSSARTQLTLAGTDLAAAREAVLERDHPGGRQALDRAAGRSARAERQARRFPLGLVRPLPVLGSPVRATDAAARAALELVAAGRLVLSASAEFPSSATAAPAGGHDLSEMHRAARGSVQATREARAHLDAARAVLAGPSSALLPPVSSPARLMVRHVDRIGRQLDGTRRAMSLLADLTAPTTDARLLLLAQDSLELRPTGGYIGSFGVLRFSGGAVNLERYDDTASLPAPDPPMDAPEGLRDMLPSVWGLSNANWWPDFPTTASTAAEMFRRQGGGEVAGVLAVTDEAMGRLVGAVGPITVPGYRHPISEKGFQKRLLYEVELKRPLDTPRKRFIIELAKELFPRVFRLPADRLPKLTEAFRRSAAAGDIQVWFADGRQQYIDGTVVAGRLPQTKRDFVMLVDANLSASKANLGLVKEARYSVRREGDDGRWRAHLDVTVRNGVPESVINPYYTGYLRVYAPSGARLVRRGPEQTHAGRARDGPYEVFTQWLDVPPEAERRVSFDYILPPSVAADKRYELTWVRQPGTPRDVLIATAGGREEVVPQVTRALVVQQSLRGSALAEFLSRRWIVRKLGLG